MRKRVCKGLMEFRQEGYNGNDVYICNACGKVILKNDIKNTRKCSLNKKLNTNENR